MTPSGRFEPRVSQRVCAGTLSAILHAGLFLAFVVFGGRQQGRDSADSPTMKLVLLEALDADRTDGIELPPLDPATPTTDLETLLEAAISMPAQLSTDTLAPEPEQPEPPGEPAEATETVATESIEQPPAPLPTIAIPEADKEALAKRLADSAAESGAAARTQLSWEQDGRQYSAVLIRERANDGTALERVIAEVSASDSGRLMTTRVSLKRLAFSQFTQVVDRWDPMVQLHEDEIVGRFHTNTQFNMMYDSRVAPKFLGKVTTAARGFRTEAKGRRREADIFQGGVETRASRIGLPEELQPFEWAPRDDKARVHEIASDARLRFFPDGSYTWRMPDSTSTQYVNDPSEHPVYFIAARGATLYVEGTVAGKILVYSPERIVIEGDLTYAHDPRTNRDSRDYLGLVSDKYVEVAHAGVTGPGDLEIDAAIFAGRRFIVTDIDRPRKATLRIYGSLSAGSLSATEPRYATRIEYDERFERVRPPGFPHTNRYEVGDWDGQWTEVSQPTERAAAEF